MTAGDDERPGRPNHEGRAHPAPDAALISRLKDLVKETQERYGTPHLQTHREATRLADQHFEHMQTTPFGEVPLFSLPLPSLSLPASIPTPLATTWGVSARTTRLVALDIETAARVGGNRDCPFVIGMAWQDASSLRLEQLVLRGPEDEAAALWALDQCLAESSHLMTYNGSRFDLPLLNRRSRALHHEPFSPPCDVIDLEPFTRAVFGRTGFSSKLTDVEERVLAAVRPAWTWHPLWREDGGLSWRRRRHVARILAKNGQDTLSLLMLFRVVCELVTHPGDDPQVPVFIARALERSSPQDAVSWYELAASGPLNEMRLHAALAAWRLGGGSKDRLASTLEEGAHSPLAGACAAAEQLGLAAWRAGDLESAVRWTGEALRHAPPVRAAIRLSARLSRWSARTAR